LNDSVVDGKGDIHEHILCGHVLRVK
jgi:hypothetical protein